MPIDCGAIFTCFTFTLGFKLANNCFFFAISPTAPCYPLLKTRSVKKQRYSVNGWLGKRHFSNFLCNDAVCVYL